MTDDGAFIEKNERVVRATLGEADVGHLEEGSTTFIARMGTAMGFVKGVSVGWDSIPELVIELKDNASAGVRFDTTTLSAAASGEEEIGEAAPQAFRTVKIVRAAINGKTSFAGGAVQNRIV